MASNILLRNVTRAVRAPVAVPTVADTAAHAPRRTRLRRAPTIEEVEEASSDLGNAFRLRFLTPPVPAPGPRIVEVTEGTEVEPRIEPPRREIVAGPSPNNFMNRAFQWFCDPNSHFRRMVTSLATDERVVSAVMENEVVREFLNAPAIEDDGDDGARTGSRTRDFNIFSLLYWTTKQAFDSFISSFQDFMARLFETGPGSGMSANENSGFYENGNILVINAGKLFAIMVLVVVVLKKGIL